MLLTQKPQTKFVDFKLLKNVEWNSNVRKITMTKNIKLRWLHMKLIHMTQYESEKGEHGHSRDK